MSCPWLFLPLQTASSLFSQRTSMWDNVISQAQNIWLGIIFYKDVYVGNYRKWCFFWWKRVTCLGSKKAKEVVQFWLVLNLNRKMSFMIWVLRLQVWKITELFLRSKSAELIWADGQSVGYTLRMRTRAWDPGDAHLNGNPFPPSVCLSPSWPFLSWPP